MASTGTSASGRPVLAAEPHLFESLAEDHFFHIEDEGLNTSVNLKEKFGDVKFVLMGGARHRAEATANYISKEFGWPVEVIGSRERYAIYKVGPVISLSHGIGMPSMLIILHEFTKVLHYAGCTDVTYIRIGTSGGVGVPPGTVVIANGGLNAALEACHELTVLGKKRRYPATFDQDVVEELEQAAKAINVPAAVGKTLSTDDYYEEQSRLDGAIHPGYTEEEKFAWLKEVHAAGVLNMEMEATALAAFCGRTGVKVALVCSVLLDRLKGDQTPSQSTPELISKWNMDASLVALEWIRGRLAKQP